MTLNIEISNFWEGAAEPETNFKRYFCLWKAIKFGVRNCDKAWFYYPSMLLLIHTYLVYNTSTSSLVTLQMRQSFLHAVARFNALKHPSDIKINISGVLSNCWNHICRNWCRFHSSFCFSFWSTKLQKYYIMYVYFFIIGLARLALQTENIVKKTTQPK